MSEVEEISGVFKNNLGIFDLIKQKSVKFQKFQEFLGIFNFFMNFVVKLLCSKTDILKKYQVF
jgi:hypothetical protein